MRAQVREKGTSAVVSLLDVLTYEPLKLQILGWLMLLETHNDVEYISIATSTSFDAVFV